MNRQFEIDNIYVHKIYILNKMNQYTLKSLSKNKFS